MRSFTEVFADAIIEKNKEMNSHAIRFTTGEHAGRYLHWDCARTVKTKKSAKELVNHSEKSRWLESHKGELDILGNPDFEVVSIFTHS